MGLPCGPKALKGDQSDGELVQRYELGEYTAALSREYGTSKSGLLQLLRAEGVAFRRQAIRPEDADRAVPLYESSLTIQQVVEEVGYSYGSNPRVLHGYGVTVRERGIGKRVAPG